MPGTKVCRCEECDGTEFFWHCLDGGRVGNGHVWGLATCLRCKVLNWFDWHVTWRLASPPPRN